jgi:hypothetical protein
LAGQVVLTYRIKLAVQLAVHYYRVVPLPG